MIAVWGCGPVGQFAILNAFLLGAERVITIDHYPERLRMARELSGAVALHFDAVAVPDALRAMTGGRAPDACIDAVGMEAHGSGISYIYGRLWQTMKLESDRPRPCA